MPQLSTGLPDARWLRPFRARLLKWFARHRRALPWRADRDPYRVWLSEIMLQQTQVATVVPYFERFVAAFPNVRALARADETEILRLWEGLGYYRRARQLHAAARAVVEEHGGQFPQDVATLERLPGIGRYTAGAIASIAFDISAPIVEANTVRLYSRLLARSASAAELWQFAEHLLPERGAGDLNQALMELGSLVCTPKAPRCDECPVMALCPTHAQGLQESIPAPKAKPKFESVTEAAVIVRRGRRVLVRQRQPGERWAGLWDFVRFPLVAPSGPARKRELARKTHEQTGCRVEEFAPFATLKHGVTRFRITLECHTARHVTGRHSQHDGAPLRWLRVSELETLPLCTTGRQLAKLLKKNRIAS